MYYWPIPSFLYSRLRILRTKIFCYSSDFCCRFSSCVVRITFQGLLCDQNRLPSLSPMTRTHRYSQAPLPSSLHHVFFTSIMGIHIRNKGRGRSTWLLVSLAGCLDEVFAQLREDYLVPGSPLQVRRLVPRLDDTSKPQARPVGSDKTPST